MQQLSLPALGAPQASPAPTNASGDFLSNLFIDPTTLRHDGYGFVHLLMLGAGYALVLMNSANLIKDGSELLLLIPSWAGLVGSIVLPVLGAVPDGAIVLFSGMGPDAQTQLAVGIGALAGSTIMLLTVPWFLSLIAGRVNLDADGNGNYVKPRGAGAEWAKLNPPSKFADTGVNLGPSILHACRVMLVTLIPFFVIQIPAIVERCATKIDEPHACKQTNVAAMIGGALCIVMFVGYLVDQWRLAKNQEDVVTDGRVEEVQKKAIDNGLMSLKGIFADRVGEGVPKEQEAFRRVLKSYFRKFDRDNSGSIDKVELKYLLESLGEQPTQGRVDMLMAQIDVDRSGAIDFDEFCKAMQTIVIAGPGLGGGRESFGGVNAQGAAAPLVASAEGGSEIGRATDVGGGGAADGDEDEEEEEDEMPEDLANLPPDEQRKRILRRSFGLMGLGTVVVVIFSDPMVGVLSELGNRMTIPPFYVAFVLAPLVSNGSELIAAYAYAGKKTEKTITISFATLVGSAAMNNSFCLAIFLFLVGAQSLHWTFTAEVTSILFVEVVMLILCHLCGRVMRAWVAIVVIALWPLSIALVAILEAAGLD